MPTIAPATHAPATPEMAAYFALFPNHELSPFQTHAIEAIVRGKSVLITAHTGSGKTLPAEFAIRHFAAAGRRIIYCSPIKALSNQKFYEFQEKYPDITFGLMTGDNKINPTATCLIMTTEILMNYLWRGGGTATATGLMDFQIDVQTELACVILDEVHYINDAHRGHVWEKTLMMLPLHVRLVMLSATIDRPLKFAEWCERLPERPVVICQTDKRVVPLGHYLFTTTTQDIFKKIKDKAVQAEIRAATNRLVPIKTAEGEFREAAFAEIHKTLLRLDTNRIFIKRKFVLNQALAHLKEQELLPALAFVFSRRMVEECAREITVPVLEDDSKVPYITRRDCDALLRARLPNHAEYMHLPEYEGLVALLEKGVGIHHAGMIPVFREIVELFISQRRIKVLFATESFAIGLDCPIKSVIFMSLTKFDGVEERLLQSHEYTQMAGRAGRRGIDTVGYVIHLSNLFRMPSLPEYRAILGGQPQKFVSKFGITAELVLNMVQQGVADEGAMQDYCAKSLMNRNLLERRAGLAASVAGLEAQLSAADTPDGSCSRALELLQEMETAGQGRRKQIHAEMAAIRSQVGADFDAGMERCRKRQSLAAELRQERQALDYSENCLQLEIGGMCGLLEAGGFICRRAAAAPEWSLTEAGVVATAIHEANGLLFAQVPLEDTLEWTPQIWVELFSCFCEVVFTAEAETDPDPAVEPVLCKLQDWLEANAGFWEGQEMPVLGGGLCGPMRRWCDCDDETACKTFIQGEIAALGVSIGDFVKVVLKVVALKKEVEKMMAAAGDRFLPAVHALSQVEGLVSKYVMTAQSLYL